MVCDYIRLTHDKVVSVWIDDFIEEHQSHEPEGYSPLKTTLQSLGLELHPDKTVMASSEIDYIGFRFDLKQNKFKLKAETADRISSSIKKILSSNQIDFKSLERVIGRIVFAARTSVTGLTKSWHLINLKNQSSNVAESIEVGDRVKKELQYWLQHTGSLL